MKTTALLITLALAACAPTPAAWQGTPNPLDKPGNDGSLPTVAGMHRANVAWITRNPAYR